MKGSEAARVLSKLGAAKGGRARAKSLTSDQRSAIAQKAANAKWAKVRQKQGV